MLVAAAALAVAGCATTHTPMPTPILYTGANAKPLFEESLGEARSPNLDLLFITDRAAAQVQGDAPYTAERSRALAFGSATIEFDEGGRVSLGKTTELGRFPTIPYELEGPPEAKARARAVVAAHERAKAELQAEITRRLAVVPRKEVVLFVHGYNNTFEKAALTMGELCHYLGREFVCAFFTWPAGGRRGILFGYGEDGESAVFAVADLEKTIRTIASTPGVEKIHFIAHSRGTDTLTSALSELSVEAYMRRSSPSREFRIANVVLVAPDLDADVALTKIFKVFSDPDIYFGDEPAPSAVIPPAPDLKFTFYVSRDDKALATAGWLLGSITRLGRIDASMLTADQIAQIGALGTVDIVQVRSATDFFGHSYFITNPRVSSDIIAMLRYSLRPNDPGRPLTNVAGSFWQLGQE
jgi:esterase/lipase superfamily enzyme